MDFGYLHIPLKCIVPRQSAAYALKCIVSRQSAAYALKCIVSRQSAAYALKCIVSRESAAYALKCIVPRESAAYALKCIVPRQSAAYALKRSALYLHCILWITVLVDAVLGEARCDGEVDDAERLSESAWKSNYLSLGCCCYVSKHHPNKSTAGTSVSTAAMLNVVCIHKPVGILSCYGWVL